VGAPYGKGHFEADSQDALRELSGAGAEGMRVASGWSVREGAVEAGGRVVATHVEALHDGENGSGSADQMVWYDWRWKALYRVRRLLLLGDDENDLTAFGHNAELLALHYVRATDLSDCEIRDSSIPPYGEEASI
jgi:hypothetical protein